MYGVHGRRRSKRAIDDDYGDEDEENFSEEMEQPRMAGTKRTRAIH